MKNLKWWDVSHNPITGCTPVSAGCEHCWAKAYSVFRPITHKPGHEFNEIIFHPERLDIPFHWRKPKRIFVCSMGDLFHEQVTDRQINEVWNVAFRNPRHTFMFLTKRPDRLLAWTKEAALVKMWPCDEIWPDWMWLGVTAENQEMFDLRWPIISQIPAAKLFVSGEPLLGGIDFLKYEREPDWFIVGKETGPGARPMNLGWVRSLRDQCIATPFLSLGIPFFYKNGLLDGKLWQQFPEVKSER